MNIVAEKVVTEFSEQNIVKLRTMYSVLPNETIADLFHRIGLDGKTSWHYDHAEITLKLVKGVNF